MANIEIIGGDKLVRSIAKRADKSRVNHVVKRNTAQVQQKAQKYAAVDTGFMKRSITIEVSDLEGRVSVGAEYAPYVEYGTRFNGSQPFMRPARNEQTQIFLNDMKNLIKRG